MLFYVSTLCHFLVVPFAFLYTESEGLGHSTASFIGGGRKVLSRLRETSVTLALVLALVALLVQVLGQLHVPLMQQQPLTLSYIVTAMLGSLIFLVLVPFGFEGYICLAIRHAQQAIVADQDTADFGTVRQLQGEACSWASWRQQQHQHHHQLPHHNHVHQSLKLKHPLHVYAHHHPQHPPQPQPQPQPLPPLRQNQLQQRETVWGTGATWQQRAIAVFAVGRLVVS